MTKTISQDYNVKSYRRVPFAQIEHHIALGGKVGFHSFEELIDKASRQLGLDSETLEPYGNRSSNGTGDIFFLVKGMPLRMSHLTVRALFLCFGGCTRVGFVFFRGGRPSNVAIPSSESAGVAANINRAGLLVEQAGVWAPRNSAERCILDDYIKTQQLIASNYMVKYPNRSIPIPIDYMSISRIIDKSSCSDSIGYSSKSKLNKHMKFPSTTSTDDATYITSISNNDFVDNGDIELNLNDSFASMESIGARTDKTNYSTAPPSPVNSDCYCDSWLFR